MSPVPHLLPCVVTVMLLGAPLARAQEGAPGVEDRAEAARLESINRLRILIGDTTDARKPEMMLRLGELYVEEARALQQRGVAAQIAARDRCFDTPGCDPEQVAEPAELAEARAWYERAAKVYGQVLARWPEFERADEASASLATALAELGRPDDAAAELTRLVRTWPTSAQAPRAWLLLGEHWFDRDNPQKALVAYQHAASSADAEVRGYARYKLAWCWYNVGELDAAVATMTQVLDDRGDLQDEALRDLVRFYADQGDVDGAERVVARHGRPELLRDALGRLAATSAEQGKLDQAVLAWRRVLAVAPEHPDAPVAADAIVRALMKMDRKEDALAELARVRAQYGPQGPWARANAARPEALAAARDLHRASLRDAASTWHAEARKLKTGPAATRAYTHAERAYAAFLQDHADAAGAVDLRYGYAELLYATGRPELAYPEYMAVVAADPKGGHARFCAESAVFAARKVVEREARPAPEGAAPVALSAWDERLLAALDQYTALYEGPKATAAIYEAGWLLYHRNHLRDAAARFDRVIALDPRAKEAELAAGLVLDGLALQGDWEALRDQARVYRDQPKLGSAAFKAEAQATLEDASMKLVEARLAKDQDRAAAGRAYLAFAEAYPKSRHADLALHNATVHLRAAVGVTEAIAAGEALVAGYPRSSHHADALAGLGFDYESLARFDDAARAYEALAAEAPAHPAAAEALYSAAVFRAALGQPDQAQRDYQALLARHPDRADAPLLQLEVAQLHERAGRTRDAAAIYLRFRVEAPAGATLDQQLFARLHEGLLTGQAAPWTDALALWDRAGASPEEHPGAAAAAAEIRFRLAEPAFTTYAALGIDGPTERGLSPSQVDRVLQRQVAAKVRGAAELERRYTAVVETGSGEWGVAALDRVGAAYEDLADALRHSYVPGYLTPEQAELYRLQLEDLAWAQEERAATVYAVALDRAWALQLYDAPTGHAALRLATLRPEAFPGSFEVLPAPRFAAAAVTTVGWETE